MENFREEFSRRLSILKDSRYPIMLILCYEKNLFHSLTEQISGVIIGKKIDYLNDILNTEKSPVLGAYDRHEFVEWIKQESRMVESLFVYNAEPLVATWSENEVKCFVDELLRIENYGEKYKRIPIIFLLFLPATYKFPDKDIGQGLLWRIE